jgi:hypothetical protein
VVVTVWSGMRLSEWAFEILGACRMGMSRRAGPGERACKVFDLVKVAVSKTGLASQEIVKGKGKGGMRVDKLVRVKAKRTSSAGQSNRETKAKWAHPFETGSKERGCHPLICGFVCPYQPLVNEPCSVAAKTQ